jgi:hypothetical protein
MVQKADTGLNVVPAFALDTKPHSYLRLPRLPVDYGTAHNPSSASMTISV